MRITPRALGEDEDALAMPQHLLRRAAKRLPRAARVGAVDEHGPAEGHEPAEKGHAFEARFGGHGTPGREDAREEQDVQLALVVPDDDAGAGGAEVVFSRDDVEGYAGGVAHDEGEGAGGEVLGEAVGAEGAEEEGDEDAVGGAEDEGGVGGEDAGVEGEAGEGGMGEGGEGVEGWG